MMRHAILLALVLALLSVSAPAQTPPAVITAKDGSRMVLVPAGPFVMGSGEGLPDEAPPRRVDLPAFYIDACEVTVTQYAAFLKATSTPPPSGWNSIEPPAGTQNLPITNITWFDAMRYAAWAGKRLPTEAEWEKAARGTDGRRFPWGNADDEARRNLETSRKLEPVGSRPAGASPYGAMDMSGNAWEWTADWYDGYPGTLHRSVQFGRKYKVVRGGGAEYYYGLRNPGTTTARCRTLPYGSHDFIGFRCAQSVDPVTAPYEPQKLLAEAQNLLNGALRPPLKLTYEQEYDAILASGSFPLQITGTPGSTGAVRAGIPFPKGLLKDPAAIRITGPDGKPRISQKQVLSHWEDGSARWVLTTFPAATGETCTLSFRGSPAQPESPSTLKVAREPDAISINTGTATIVIKRDGLLDSVRLADGSSMAGLMQVRLSAMRAGKPVDLKPMPAEKMDVEEAGPVSATVRLQGALGAEQIPSAFRYDLRITATARSSRVRLLLTLTHKAKRTATADVQSACATFLLDDIPPEVLFATDRGTHSIAGEVTAQLEQIDDLNFRITDQASKLQLQGTRAPGWMAIRLGRGWLLAGQPEFWQNHPQALATGQRLFEFDFWSGDKPFDWEGGLAKTHEIILDFSPTKPDHFDMAPLRASLPRAWACGTDAMGAPMLPRGKEALERFPYWELFRQSGMYEFVRGMPTGMRHWGDSYLGGPYKGKNAYSNLEYDVGYNFLMEYLRTGDPWYLDAVGPMARHQADIDTDHFTGQPWKHSPQHTTTEAELGHVFIRGMLMHYLLTGERRSLDAAIEVGDWIAATLEKGQGTGNERQIGWSVYALTGLYDVTRDIKYLHACETLCNRLLRGQSSTGQFTNIRWDNRISFFNGIAMNGMLTVYQNNHDEKLAEGIMKVANRTLGMYPEYACRTLNAYIWAARRTNDPRFLDAIERTWELSTEYLPEAVTTETHAWHFRQFAARQNLFPLFDKPPAATLDPATWQGVRFERGEAEVYLQPRSAASAPVMIVREGHAEGRAQLFDASGSLLGAVELNDSSRTFQAGMLALPPSATACRLRLTSAKDRAWQIHYDRGSRLTVFDPIGAQVPDLYPRAYGMLEDGAKTISIKLEATGEGFHTATLYDPDGKPVKTVRHFIDFEDPGRYELELKLDSKAPLPAGKPWSLEVYKLKVLGVKGMLPYWAGRPDQLFHPERTNFTPVSPR